MSDIDRRKPPTARKLSSMLERAGVTDLRPDAAIWYGLDWGAYGYGAGFLAGPIIGLVFALLIRATFLPNPKLDPGATIGLVVVWIVVSASISWVGRIWGNRYASGLQLRRIDPGGKFVLPALGWLAICEGEICVWVARKWWPLRLNPEPACRVSTHGWSMSLPGRAVKGRTNTVVVSDPDGRAVAFICSSGSDIEQVGRLLREQNETPTSPID